MLGIAPARAACRSLGSTAKPSMVSHFSFLQDPIRVPRSLSGDQSPSDVPGARAEPTARGAGRTRAISPYAELRQAGGRPAGHRHQAGQAGRAQARHAESTAGQHRQAGAATEDGLCACVGFRTLVRDLSSPSPPIFPATRTLHPGKARGRQAGQATKQGQAGKQAHGRQAGRQGAA